MAGVEGYHNAPPQNPWDVDRFVVEPSEEFICSICLCVLVDPIETLCRHCFYKPCLLFWISRGGGRSCCPQCKQEISPNSMKPALPAFQNLIANLRVKCENQEKGCTESFVLEHYTNLQATRRNLCSFEVVKCRYDDCTERELRQYICEHEKQCEYRQHLICQGCQQLRNEVAELRLVQRAQDDELRRMRETLETEVAILRSESEMIRNMVHLPANVAAIQPSLHDVVEIDEVRKARPAIHHSTDRVVNTLPYTAAPPPTAYGAASLQNDMHVQYAENGGDTAARKSADDATGDDDFGIAEMFDESKEEIFLEPAQSRRQFRRDPFGGGRGAAVAARASADDEIATGDDDFGIAEMLDESKEEIFLEPAQSRRQFRRDSFGGGRGAATDATRASANDEIATGDDLGIAERLDETEPAPSRQQFRHDPFGRGRCQVVAFLEPAQPRRRQFRLGRGRGMVTDAVRTSAFSEPAQPRQRRQFQHAPLGLVRGSAAERPFRRGVPRGGFAVGRGATQFRGSDIASWPSW